MAANPAKNKEKGDDHTNSKALAPPPPETHMLLLRGARHQLRPASTVVISTASKSMASAPTTQAPPLVLVVAAAILRRRPAAAATDASSSPPPPQVLLAQRPAGKNLAGLWEFPGGKVDATDASPEHALCRELDEELGLTNLDPRRLRPLAFASHAYEDKFFHLLMPLYALELEDGDPEPRGMEGQAVAWCTGEELQSGKFALPPADDPLVTSVCSALAALEQR